jgi:hypothetical protein
LVALACQGAGCGVEGLRTEIEDQDTHHTFDARKYTMGTAEGSAPPDKIENGSCAPASKGGVALKESIIRSSTPPTPRGDFLRARLPRHLPLWANRVHTRTNRVHSQQYPFLSGRALRSPYVAGSHPGYIRFALIVRVPHNM